MARKPHPWYRASRREWYSTVNNEQVPLGVKDPADEGAAWAALKRIIAGEVLAATSPASKVRPGTIPELVTRFLADRTGVLEPRTIQSYGNHLKWAAATFPTETAASIDVAAVVREAARVDRWGDTHRANVLGTISALLKWAGRADSIPLPPKATRGADSVIPDPVYRRCLVETTGDFHQLVRFLWLTGCRPGEATGLTAEAVGWESGTITLKQHKTRKKGKTRTIYLSTEALTVLVEQLERHGAGLLFRGLRGRRFSLQAMTMRFERLSAKVGHPITSYQFRHTWATRALARGVPAAQVAEMMGHSSTAMIFRHYAHLTAEAGVLKAAAELVSRGRAG